MAFRSAITEKCHCEAVYRRGNPENKNNRVVSLRSCRKAAVAIHDSYAVGKPLACWITTLATQARDDTLLKQSP